MEPLVRHGLVDKSTWGPGPWQDEPDAVIWADEDTGYGCMILRAKTTGALNGYVGIPEGHPWYRVDKDDIPADVHFGLTFSVTDVEDPQHRWWVGFDCAHYTDVSPAMDAMFRDHVSIFMGRTYKTIAYVADEVRSLARQAREAQELLPAVQSRGTVTQWWLVPRGRPFLKVPGPH